MREVPAVSPCMPAEVSAVRRLPTTPPPARGWRRGCAQCGVREDRRRSSSTPGSRSERESSHPSRSRGRRSTEVVDSSEFHRHRLYTVVHRPLTTLRRLEGPNDGSADALPAYKTASTRSSIHSTYRHQYNAQIDNTNFTNLNISQI